MAGPSGWSKSLVWIAAAVVIVLSMVVLDVDVAGAAAALSVTPATGLRDLQRVQVDGTGFTPGLPLSTVECQAGNTTRKGCDVSTFTFGFADGTGAVHLSATVRRVITLGRHPFDCATQPCELRATGLAGPDTAAAPIAFDPNVPPVVANVAITPAAPLVDHQLVTLRGSGFTPGASALVEECAAKKALRRGGACVYGSNRSAVVGDDGTFRIRNFAVSRLLPGEAGDVDCAAKPGTCAVSVEAEDLGGATTLSPMTFDPATPPVIASASASPASRLVDHQRVTVVGHGFLPGAPVHLSQCSSGDGPEDLFGCNYGGETSVTAGFHGQFRIDVYVRRHIPSFTGATTEATIDCAAAPHRCMFELSDGSQSTTTDVALSFDAAAPAVAVRLRVAPATGLTDDQRVAAAGTSFAPYSTVTLAQCSEEALEGNLGACDQSTAQTAVAGADGRVTGSIAVHRTIGGYDGLEDCRDHAGACVVAAISDGLSINGLDGLLVGPLGPLGPLSASSTDPTAPPPVRRAANGETLPGVAFAPISFG